MGPVGPVGALGAMGSSSGGAYEWEQYPSQQSSSYGGPAYSSGNHRYDPYASYTSRYGYAQNPQASAVTGVTVGGDFDYLDTHGVSLMDINDDRRRRMQKRSSVHSQHSGYGDAESSYTGELFCPSSVSQSFSSSHAVGLGFGSVPKSGSEPGVAAS